MDEFYDETDGDEFEGEFVEYIEEEDEDDDDGDEGEMLDEALMDLDEMVESDEEGEAGELAERRRRGRYRSRRRSYPYRRRANVRRARPRGSYTSRTRGRRYGTIVTPAGKARVKLPGRFPTVSEFKQSVAKVQKDIKKNSGGIKDLVSSQKDLASVVGRNKKTTDKKVLGLQIGVVILSLLSLPQARTLISNIPSGS
jgi:hypothetical protein